MNTKRCGKKWPAHLCAPGAEHQCTRPVAPLTDRIGHPGNCCCKCGNWKPAAAGGADTEWSGRNVRCSCGAVHYDMNPEAIWTCPACGLEHVTLTRGEGRQFMEALAGEYSARDEPDDGCAAAAAGRDTPGGTT